MRKLLKIVLVAAVAALAAALIRRLLFPEEHVGTAPAEPDWTAAAGWPSTGSPRSGSSGESPSVTSGSSGGPPSVTSSSSGGSAHNSPSRDELYKEAAQLDVKGRSKMNKRQLQEAVEAAKTGGSS